MKGVLICEKNKKTKIYENICILLPNTIWFDEGQKKKKNQFFKEYLDYEDTFMLLSVWNLSLRSEICNGKYICI